MTYVPLWQLAEDLGCDSAYDLLTGPRFRNLDLGSRFRYDGQDVYINLSVDDPMNIVVDVFSGIGNFVLRLSHDLANRLSVDYKTYERLSGKTLKDKVEATTETIEEKSQFNNTRMIVCLVCIAGVALTVYKTGVLDSYLNKKPNTKK